MRSNLSTQRPAPPSLHAIGVELACDYVHVQCLRIRIGGVDDQVLEDPELWCPSQRLRFRLPPWWQERDLIVDDEVSLREIYRAFADELSVVEHASDDPILNQSIKAAREHIASIAGGITGQQDGGKIG